MINKIWKFTLSLFIINIIVLLAVFIITTNINFNLNSEEKIYINVNTEYDELGYNVTIFKKISNKVIINSDLDTSIVNTYKIEYKLERTVNVIDDEISSIILNGDEKISLVVNQEYDDIGVIVFDNYDKDITNQIK